MSEEINKKTTKTTTTTKKETPKTPVKKTPVKTAVKKTTKTATKKTPVKKTPVKTTPTTKLAVDDKELMKVKEENEKMSTRLKQMEEMMAKILEEKETSIDSKSINSNNIELNELRANEYIEVVSLIDGMLNLSTEPYGKGKTYSFTKFGQSRAIQYGEVEGIINNQEKFIKNGYFYVSDDRVAKRHDLYRFYEETLNKETIEKILNSDDKKDIELFKMATDKQKEVIVNLYIKKIKDLDDSEIDYNKVSLFSKSFGKDVAEMIEEYKSLS